jgi:hypothetical protein
VINSHFDIISISSKFRRWISPPPSRDLEFFSLTPSSDRSPFCGTKNAFSKTGSSRFTGHPRMGRRGDDPESV